MEKQLVNLKGEPISSSAYTGARMNREMNKWRPARQSADKALLRGIPTLQARSHDMDRNNGLTSGAHQLTSDNVIGTGLTIVPNPNYQVLGQDKEWVKEFRLNAKNHFLTWANDEDNYIDVERKLTLAGLFRLNHRSELTTGEQLAVAEWLPRKGSKFNTAIHVVDPMRLENPKSMRDTETLRGGVYLGRLGNPVAYSFRVGSEIDPNYKWKKVFRENRFGRKNVFHLFDAKRPGQNRGVSAMASVIAKSKMLEKFQDRSLESAVINSMYAAYIKSDMPALDVQGAMGAVDSKTYPEVMTEVMAAKAEAKSESYVDFDESMVPHLLPGEELKVTSLNHPGPNFEAFEKAMLRHLASGLGISYEQLSRDYSDMNYSGARTALMESWKFFKTRRANSGRFGSWIYTLWLEEAIDKGVIEVPHAKGQAPIEYFWENKPALSRCEWRGNAKGHIDPLKETRADNEEVDNFMGTLEGKNAERDQDWMETVDQRMVEIAHIKKAAEAAGLSPEDLANYGSGFSPKIMTDGKKDK